MGPSIFGVLAFLVIAYSVGSVKVINQGNEALVERLGKFHRKLSPGLNFIVPFMDNVVLTETVREQLLDVEPQAAISKDNVALEVDAVVYWKILDLDKTYYAIDDIETAIQELVITTMRSEIGKMDFERTFSSREEVNKALLDQLDEATEPWGVKITRVEVQRIQPPKEVIESMQLQQAAEIKRRAAVLEAQGDREASVKRAEGTVESIRLLSDALRDRKDAREILQFLIAQRYVDANQKIGESNNSKVVFMDPKLLTEGVMDLMGTPTSPEGEERYEEPPNHKPRRPSSR